MINPTDPSANLAIDANGLESLRQSARQKSPEALQSAAKQFEALFMNMIMKSMREASPQDSMFDNDQSRMYTSMLDQQLSQKLSNRGVGLADMLVRQLQQSAGGNMAAGDPAAGDPAAGAPAAGAPAKTGVHGANSSEARKYAEWQAPASAPAADVAAGNARTKSTQAPHVRAFQDRLAAHAEEASRTTGIPAKFMLGQAALESGWGKREIRTTDGSSSHNLFGIKATAGWKGRVVEAVTTEYVNGLPQKRLEKFRAYDSYADSFRDYARLMRNNPRYEKVLANAQDANAFAHGLQRAGYATDPQYAVKLARIINHNLSV